MEQTGATSPQAVPSHLRQRPRRYRHQVSHYLRQYAGVPSRLHGPTPLLQHESIQELLRFGETALCTIERSILPTVIAKVYISASRGAFEVFPH